VSARATLAATITLALVLGAGPATRPALAWDDRDFSSAFVTREAWHRGGFEKLDLGFPVGTLEVTAHDSDSIVVWLEPHCEIGSEEDCERVLRRIHVRAKEKRRTLELRIAGGRWFDTSRVQVEARVEVPRALALQVGMGVGEVTIAGFASDVKLDLGVGEATVRSPESAFRSASVNVGIGEAMLVKAGSSRERAGVFGNALQWKAGKGAHLLGLSVGIGEASIYLD
jgi:hypothetical protein